VQDGRTFVNEHKRLIAQGIDPLDEKQKVSKVITFGDFFESEYMPNYAMKVKKSWKHDQWMYNSDLKKIFGDYLLNDISKREISKFIYSIKDRASGARANRFLSLISKVMSTALDWEFIEGENPCRRIKKFKESAGRTRYLSNNEIKRLKIALDSVPQRQRVSALAIWFLLTTGCRLGEAMSLTWDRIEIENNIAFLPQEMTKNATAHQVYLNKQAIKTLKELKKHMVRGNPHLFPSVVGPTGHLLSPRRTFDSVKKAAKLDNLRLHDLRHSFCSIVISNNNNSLYTLSKLLGHANQAMTSRYSHLRNQALIDASETVATQLESVME
jgi:integrase